MSSQNVLWIVFAVAIAGMLALDLGVFHRRSREISHREALGWTLVWIALSLLFCAGVSRYLGPRKGWEFLTGWIIEKSLSVDNLFVFILIFSYFKVERRLQHRVLLWGILGALVLRGILIAAGTALVQRFQWTLYIFGAFLVWTAWKMAFQEEGEAVEPEHNPVVRFVRRHFPVHDRFEGDRFFIVKDGRRLATPLLLVVLVVETTDVVFATDSLPAVFGLTDDPFIVYTSNVFAILGLRALYFLLAGVLGLFRFLKFGLALVLGFIGAKMLARDLVHIPILASLGVVGVVLAVSILASIAFPGPAPAPPAPDAGEGDDSPNPKGAP